MTKTTYLTLRAANTLSRMGIASDALAQISLNLLGNENSLGIRLGAANAFLSLGNMSGRDSTSTAEFASMMKILLCRIRCC